MKIKNNPARRTVWEIFNGEIPINLEVCHICDVRNCVNPKHLFLGTHKENMIDCSAKNRFLNVKRGEKNKSSKLKKEDINYILNSKDSTKKLREMFGVCQTTIWNIKNHKTWKHLFL